MSEVIVADYVVVGSGAGGGPLAARLAAAGHSVVVIEAGVATEPGDLTYEVPGFHAYASEVEEMTWAFYVQHYDDADQAHRDPKYRSDQGGVLYPRCATVGGCTAHNAMIIVRPNDADWDAVAELTGDPSWRASSMGRYFERLERCLYAGPARRLPGDSRLFRLLSRIPLLRRLVAGNGHGTDGWLPTSLANPLLLTRDLRLLWVVLKAASTQLGQLLGRRLHWHERLVGLIDPNDIRAQAESMQGLWLVPQAVAKGHRHGTREALRAATDAGAPLTVLTDTLATRLVIDDTGRCVGVTCQRGRSLYRADPRRAGQPDDEVTVNANREVVLAGGAFNSPQLLQLSGIGPAAELRRHDIEVVVDSPGVGANLQDRYEVGVVTELSGPFTLVKGGLFHPPGPGDPADPLLSEWRRRGRGPYASNGALLAVMASSRPDLAVPDLFLFALPADFRGYYPGYHRDLELKPDRLTWAVLKAHTNNRGGSVRLCSPDPCTPPDIRFRYFEEGTDPDGEDLDAVVAGVKLARRIGATLSRWDATELSPGPDIATDDELRTWVRDVAWGHHACGTCAIGPDHDPYAVLDSRFRVRGVPGLRVVDASVFPTIPGYFLVSSVLMVSEKAADVMLADLDTATPWPPPPTPEPEDRP